TFGQSAALRSGMVGGNLVVMRMLEKSHCGLLPGHVPAPWDIPKGGGFGYSIGSEREGVMWRSRRIEDPKKWLESLQPATLDDLVRNTLGELYELRHQVAREASAQSRDLVERLRHATPEEARALRAELRRLQGKTDDSRQASKVGARAAGADAGGVPEPPAMLRALNPTPDAAGQPELPLRELDAGEQQLMDLLADGREWRTSEMAERLGVSEVTVRKRIRRLESRLVNVRKGVYRAKLT